MGASFLRFSNLDLSICAAALLLAAVLTMNGDTSLARTKQTNLAGNTISVAHAWQQRTPETELITITSTGFEPIEITRPAGDFLLDIDNRSELEEVELRLDKQGGGRKRSANVRNTAPDWRGALNLSPGVYILSEANHPTWICRITISN